VRIVAFAGPSVPPDDRARFPDVEWRAPAEAGDLLRLQCERPPTICLIDGYFDHRPAVRHKEILLLLSQGARILGAASIGALRAAEMDGFGMAGVGAVYRAYALGRLTGDDEVALVHGTAELDWRALSVPLVDVRATLCGALRCRILNRLEAGALREAAAAIHYVDRSWEEILQSKPVSAGASERLRRWLPDGAVSLKRSDAIECLRAAARPAAASPTPAPVRTVFLDLLARECGLSPDLRT
jgi:hypothetical protein